MGMKLMLGVSLMLILLGCTATNTTVSILTFSDNDTNVAKEDKQSKE